MTLAANAAIPAGLQRRQTFDASAATGHAAGVLFVAPDGDVLLLRRSQKEENFAGHWSLPGGGVDEGETPPIGAAREAKEEMGVDVDPGNFKVLDQTMTPTGKAFHTFAMPVEKKFWPTINDEHIGAGWFPLSELPRPIHPAVEATLKSRLGMADDMTPEDWQGLRDGLLKWTAEEEAEPEHEGAADSVFLIAMDRDSVREKTRDGRLIVKRTHISKANVCPYRGAEIPGWEALGLEKDRVYNLLRDPEELRKAAPTLNGVQLLIKHIPVSAADHRPNETVGSLGTDAQFDGEYLDNSLFVNAQHAIDGIESGKQRELSPGYHYKPDMTPGVFRGTAFDGVMRDIVFNHVCLVEDGRTGPDVLVGDSMENLNMAKPTRFAVAVLAHTGALLAPLLAMDSKVTLPKDLFKPLTPANFKADRVKLLAGVRGAVDGKLRKGLALDASMKGFEKALDMFEGMEGEDDESAIEAASSVDPITAPAVSPEQKTSGTFDAEPLKGFLKQCGMDDANIMKACDMLPKPALDSEESDEDKKKREEKEKAEAAAKDAEMKDMVSKPALDAALKATAEAVTKSVRETEQGIRTALAAVKPWVGDLPAGMAFDSAADVHRKALSMLNVAGADKLHADALLPVLEAQPKPGAKAAPVANQNSLAMDSSAIDKASKMAPGLANIELA